MNRIAVDPIGMPFYSSWHPMGLPGWGIYVVWEIPTEISNCTINPQLSGEEPELAEYQDHRNAYVGIGQEISDAAQPGERSTLGLLVKYRKDIVAV